MMTSMESTSWNILHDRLLKHAVCFALNGKYRSDMLKIIYQFEIKKSLYNYWKFLSMLKNIYQIK